MQPLPPPHVPGNTEAERMNNAMRTIFSVSKADVLRAEQKQKRARPERRKRQRKPS